MKMHPRCFARSRPSVERHGSSSISSSISNAAGRKVIGKARKTMTRPVEQESRAHDTQGLLARDTVSRTQVLTIHAHLTLVLEIALVSDENHWEIIFVLYPKNLLMKLVDLFEGFPGGY